MQNTSSPPIPYELHNKNVIQPSNATLATAMNRLAEALEKFDRGKASVGQVRSELVAKASHIPPENEWEKIKFLKGSESEEEYSEFDMELELAQSSSSSNNNSKPNTPEGVENVADAKGAGGRKRGKPGRKPKEKPTTVIWPTKRTLEQIKKNVAVLPEYRGKD